MYSSRMFDGLIGCFVVAVVLSTIGLLAVGYGLWWLFSNINISWGG